MDAQAVTWGPPLLLIGTASLPSSLMLPHCPPSPSSTDHLLMCGNLSWGAAQPGEAENITHLESCAEGEMGREDSIFRAHSRLPPTLSGSHEKGGTIIPTPAPGHQDGWNGEGRIMKLNLRFSHPQELCTCKKKKKNHRIKSPEKLGWSFLQSSGRPTLGHATQTGIYAGI